MEVREDKPPIRERIASITGGASWAPLLLLFGLNAVDELDRSAFNVLTPEIADHFNLDLSGVTTLVALVIPASLIFALPIARFADRRSRVPMALGGAVAWGMFAVLTGLAPAIAVLYIARVGAGLGRAVNSPVHPPLLADFYPPTSRAKVFSAHRIANPVGQFVAPLIAGFVAAWVGWRTPFIILAVPTFVIVLLALLYLREPPRTGERLVEGDVKFREAFRSLWAVRTMRRLWFAFPFLAFVMIGMQPLAALYYKEVFSVRVQHRGIIQAFDAPFTVIGLIVGSVLIDRGVLKDAGRAMRFVGFAAATIGFFILGIAWAPQLWIAVSFSYLINVLAPILLTAGIVVMSLISPPESRASGFALFEIFSLLGVISLPIVGIVGEEYGIRTGMAILAPALFVGSAIVASSARFVRDDIKRIYPDYGKDPESVPPHPEAEAPTTTL